MNTKSLWAVDLISGNVQIATIAKYSSDLRIYEIVRTFADSCVTNLLTLNMRQFSVRQSKIVSAFLSCTRYYRNISLLQDRTQLDPVSFPDSNGALDRQNYHISISEKDRRLT